MVDNISTIITFGFGVGAFFASISFILGYSIYSLLSTFEDIAKLG